MPLTCAKCHASWENRKDDPVQCPRCKSLGWRGGERAKIAEHIEYQRRRAREAAEQKVRGRAVTSAKRGVPGDLGGLPGTSDVVGELKYEPVEES